MYILKVIVAKRNEFSIQHQWTPWSGWFVRAIARSPLLRAVLQQVRPGLHPSVHLNVSCFSAKMYLRVFQLLEGAGGVELRSLDSILIC